MQKINSKIKHPRQMHKPVAIIMGSKTDWNSLEDAKNILTEFGISVHVEVVSAHRTPEKMQDFALNAVNKYSLIIAAAGGAAHLPGMVASLTTLPVIGVPVTVGKLKGIDALLSIVQMPKGVPVATVAIDNSFNAGLLAARILSIGNSELTKKLEQFKMTQVKKVKTMNADLKKLLK